MPEIAHFSVVTLFPPQIPYSFPGISEDVMRLKRLFENSLRLISWKPILAPRILNLACGRADETGTLLEVFCPQGAAGTYLGADLRHAEIQEARRRWSALNSPQFAIEFLVADASSLHALPMQSKFDVIFLRHQNYWDAPAVWDAIFQHALGRLQEKGLLIFTSYFEREHELAIAALQTKGATLLVNVPHRDSRPLAEAPGKSVDRRLAIFAHAGEIFANPSQAILAHPTNLL